MRTRPATPSAPRLDARPGSFATPPRRRGTRPTTPPRPAAVSLAGAHPRRPIASAGTAPSSSKPGADLPAVRKAYRRLLKQYHPDKFAKDPDKYKAATEVTRNITEAYDGLTTLLGA